MIVLQPHNLKQVAEFTKRPPHGVLLTGPEGSGKLFLSRYLAANILNVSTVKLDVYPYFRIISPEESSISIDQIREMQKYLKLKTTGSAAIRRVVVVHDAHTMTVEAQNALLKSLEEPPEDTVIILTSLETMQLKSTVLSRVQVMSVLPVAKDLLFDKFSELGTANEMEKAFLLSGGYVGLFASLLQDDDHQLTNAVKSAKVLLTSTPYERLLMIDELSKKKELIPEYLYALRLIASTALRQSSLKRNNDQVKLWFDRVERFYLAESRLKHNPNIKLLLTDLFLSV